MAVDTFILEIGETSVKVGDFEVKHDVITPLSAGMEPVTVNMYASAAEEVVKPVQDSIKKLLTDAKIVKNAVSLLIPDSHSYASILKMPLLTEKELISAIRYQADQFIPVPIDKVNLDLEVLEEDKPNKSLTVLLVAASKTVTERVTTMVEGLGLIPESLETETSAVVRFFDFYLKHPSKATTADTTSHFLAINMGANTSSLMMLDKAKKIPVAIHTMNTGFDVFLRDIRNNTQLDPVKAQQLLKEFGLVKPSGSINPMAILQTLCSDYVTEIKRFIASVSESQKIQMTPHILLFNQSQSILGFDSMLSKSLGIPANYLTISDMLTPNDVTTYFKNDWPAFIPLIGASIR